MTTKDPSKLLSGLPNRPKEGGFRYPYYSAAYCPPLILAELGHNDLAWELYRRRGNPDTPDWFEPDFLLRMAWVAAIVGQPDDAAKMARACVETGKPEMLIRQALMLRQLITTRSADFAAYLDARGGWSWDTRRATLARMATLARAATEAEVKSLAAYHAGSLVMALDHDRRTAADFWRVGEQAGGLYSRLCRDLLASVPEDKEVGMVTTHLACLEPAPADLRPSAYGFGLTHRPGSEYRRMDTVEFYDSRGNCAASGHGIQLSGGSGWWLYIADFSPSWTPGWWTIHARYGDSVEVHGRNILSLVPRRLSPK